MHVAGKQMKHYMKPINDFSWHLDNGIEVFDAHVNLVRVVRGCELFDFHDYMGACYVMDRGPRGKLVMCIGIVLALYSMHNYVCV